MAMNPLQKKKPLKDKVSEKLHLKKRSKSEQVLLLIQQYGLYVGLFLAGYLTAIIQQLLSI
jgi:hypothetical protein